MGCGMSTEDKEGKARNEEIENQLKRDKMNQRNEIKMLLLGALLLLSPSHLASLLTPDSSHTSRCRWIGQIHHPQANETHPRRLLLSRRARVLQGNHLQQHSPINARYSRGHGRARSPIGRPAIRVPCPDYLHAAPTDRRRFSFPRGRHCYRYTMEGCWCSRVLQTIEGISIEWLCEIVSPIVSTSMLLSFSSRCIALHTHTHIPVSRCCRSVTYHIVPCRAYWIPFAAWCQGYLDMIHPIQQPKGKKKSEAAIRRSRTALLTLFPFPLTLPFHSYFDSIQRIAAPDYLPNDQDVLRSRVKTTGITETTFIIGDLTYRMFDVGGQRSERKKWIHCFENVTTILFLVAISEYDQLLFEDETVNRMQEALTLFDSICNSRWFLKTSIILFLNKIDRFKEKLPVSPMKNYFPDYEGMSSAWLLFFIWWLCANWLMLGGADYAAACDYILNRFVSLNQAEQKQVYTHFTCATDTSQIRFVMAAVNGMI